MPTPDEIDAASRAALRTAFEGIVFVQEGFLFMNHIPVSSSNIASVAYCSQTRTLEVRFKDKTGGPGALYEYVEVPEHVFDSFMSAPSKGVYFAAHIKTKYRASKVG